MSVLALSQQTSIQVSTPPTTHTHAHPTVGNECLTVDNAYTHVVEATVSKKCEHLECLKLVKMTHKNWF